MEITNNATYLITIKKTICCPDGRCIFPVECYALDRSRSYPVQIHEASEAVHRLIQSMLQGKEN